MLHWWNIDGSNYNTLQQMIYRSSTQLCGFCDIDRSYNDFTTMIKEPTAHAMTPLTKKTTVTDNEVKKLLMDMILVFKTLSEFFSTIVLVLLFPSVCTC